MIWGEGVVYDRLDHVSLSHFCALFVLCGYAMICLGTYLSVIMLGKISLSAHISGHFLTHHSATTIDS